ncbi:hypothetical protein GALL_188570 [mine drainage metagenome]|uniref:DUF937 domain-containing protein n=1 Tax=mine drainage metagenome TaxID=410659 RepID=A0A1J5RS54_9ZZZZ
MGLFDSLAGAVLSKVGGEQGKMAQIAMDLFNQNGGLPGILEKFQQNGMAEQAASWVSKGTNLPITAEQITSVLGSSVVAEIATKFGISPELLSSNIAENLPNMVDKMTPDGVVPANPGNLLAALMDMMK